MLTKFFSNGARMFHRPYGLSLKHQSTKVNTETLIGDTGPLFDAISDLNYLGIKLSSFARLFTIGNQSSGKSSVLDSLIGGYGLLPKKMGIATLKPINLTTIRSNKTLFKIGDQDFTDETLARMEVERQNLNTRISSIDIKVYSPNVVNMSLTDCPGLFLVPDSNNPDLHQKIEELSIEYLKDPNTIPVVISEAPTDPANNLALRLIANHNERKQDAIGILTKTDMSVRQSMDIINDMLANKRYPLGGSWVAVVLRNKEELDSGMTVEQKIIDENRFFRNYPNLHPCGVETMRRMISNLQFKKIKNNIPKLLIDIESTILSLETSNSIFGTLMNDPAKTMPKKLELLISKLGNGSIERAEFEKLLQEEFKRQIMSHITKILDELGTKEPIKGTINVDPILLSVLREHYVTRNDKIYHLKDSVLQDDHFKELFSYGFVSPIVVSNETLKRAFDDEYTLLQSIGLIKLYIDDPLGKKRLKWNRSLQKFFQSLTHEGYIQDIIYKTTERMIIEYIQTDPEANDDLTIKFSEYMLKEIGTTTYTENIRFGIQSMINAEKRPNVLLSELGRHLFRQNPEFSEITMGFFGTPYKKMIPIEVYGSHWSNAYLSEVADRISENCYQYVAVNLIDPMVQKLLEMSIDMVNKNRIEQEQSKISEKISKLRELQQIISHYNQ